MKYKVGDSFLIPVEIATINKDKVTPYFISGCAGVGWWSESALNDLQKLACADCRWMGVRHQKCSCCIRNRGMKDNYQDDIPKVMP